MKPTADMTDDELELSMQSALTECRQIKALYAEQLSEHGKRLLDQYLAADHELAKRKAANQEDEG